MNGPTEELVRAIRAAIGKASAQLEEHVIAHKIKRPEEITDEGFKRLQRALVILDDRLPALNELSLDGPGDPE